MISTTRRSCPSLSRRDTLRCACVTSARQPTGDGAPLLSARPDALRIPSEFEFAQVSRMTARRAIDELVMNVTPFRQQGGGIFVAHEKMPVLSVSGSVSTTMRTLGLVRMAYKQQAKHRRPDRRLVFVCRQRTQQLGATRAGSIDRADRLAYYAI